MTTQMSTNNGAQRASFEARVNEEIEVEKMVTPIVNQMRMNYGAHKPMESAGTDEGTTTIESRNNQEIEIHISGISIALTCSDKGAAIEAIEGKTVVVGIRMDSQSREILTWALIKVAMPGDRVVALHVLAGRDRGDDLVTLAKEFDAMLSVYEGFCNLKQVDLKLRICKGSSIRKVLVREAGGFGASQLILGVALNNRSVGSSSVSIAKYCAKKLSSSCSVLALNNGKIVFQREVAEKSFGQKGLSHELTKVFVNGDVNDLCGQLPMVSQNEQIEEDSEVRSVLRTNEMNCSCNIATIEKDFSICDVSPRDGCSLCSPDIQPPSSSQLKDNPLLAMVETGKYEIPSRNVLPTPLGWRLLKRLIFSTKRGGLFDKPKNPTIHWSMRLPNRSALVHPDQKLVTSDGNQIVNLGCDSCAAVQGEADMARPYTIYNDVEWRSPEELEALRKMYSSSCRLFSFEELVKATSNFSPEMLIGRGGSSSVYKGCLPDGKELAVKTLKGSEETLKEFISEIEILTVLQHKNIISLRGFCIEVNNLILVYDYLSKGSLEEILHGEKEIKHILSWPERYKIALGVAKALSYLHGDGTTEPVIHRDVKSSNILTSEDLEPQLSDFGLAKWPMTSGSRSTPNDIAGTFGYLAPECFLYGKVNEKVDVYAFGVVLLELLSGRKPISTFPSGKESLVMWAKPILLDGDLKQIIDPCLGNDYDNNQAERVMLSASLCTRRLNHARPQSSVVLKLLEGDDDVVNWARLEVNTYKIIDCLDGIAIPEDDIQSHLSLALLDNVSISSTVHAVGYLSTRTSVEDYMQWRAGLSSSFI